MGGRGSCRASLCDPARREPRPPGSRFANPLSRFQNPRMIGSLLQADFEEIIQAKDWEGLRDALSELDPSDIAELLMDLPVSDEGIIFRMLPREKAADVFEYLPRERQQSLIKSL